MRRGGGGFVRAGCDIQNNLTQIRNRLHKMMFTYPNTIKNPVTSTFSLAKLSPNRSYLLWWYAALVKGTESGQQNLQVLFREILSWSDVGLELGKAEKEPLPLPLLGQYRIGSI